MKLRLEVYILTIFVLLFSINIASAITVDEIMDKMEETVPDFTTQKTISEMILIDEEGNEEVREMIMFSQEGEDEKSSTLVRFLSPKSVKGVTLLNIDDGEKIYLYMPAYGKARRIAGSSKGDEFMGTGLSYEDMSMNYEDKDYEKKLLEETESVYIIEVIPSDEDTSYKKIILAVDKKKFYIKKVEFYDMRENLIKTLEIDKIKIDDKGKITPMEIVFADIEENQKTKIVMKEIEYDIELSPRFFSLQYIKRPKL